MTIKFYDKGKPLYSLNKASVLRDYLKLKHHKPLNLLYLTCWNTIVNETALMLSFPHDNKIPQVGIHTSHILRKGASNTSTTCIHNTWPTIDNLAIPTLIQVGQLQWMLYSLLVALPTEILYVGSPPWLFVRMSIVQSPSTCRLSLITEHFLAPKVIPLVKNPARSFPTNTSISAG